MHVSKKYKDIFVGVKAEVARSHLVDLGVELFHVDSE